MRVFFATVFLLFSLFAYTQADTARRADTAIKVPPATPPESDSAFVKMQRQIDSTIRAMNGEEDIVKDDEEMKLTENNIKNIQSIMHIRQEAEEKKTRRAQMQIALGVLFFVLLLIGMLRRRKR